MHRWETLSDRRICIHILQIHKIMNNKTPSYLKDKQPPKHRLFLFNVFRKIKCKINRYMNIFFPHVISSWNLFISHFEVFPSSDSLKDHVLSLFRPMIKSIFCVHDPVGLRYLFQLRVRPSPLRSHKSHHNFIDTPSNICQRNQDFIDTPSDICQCNQGVEVISYSFVRYIFLKEQSEKRV